MKQGSNQAIRFFVMETMKDWYRGGDNNKPVPKMIVGVFGACAGAASVFGNTPIDVVKTRMQVSIAKLIYCNHSCNMGVAIIIDFIFNFLITFRHYYYYAKSIFLLNSV